MIFFTLLFKLFFKLIKDYHLFFISDDKCYYINICEIDESCKDIVFKSNLEGVNLK